jgi:small subunit ribosomal protein S8
MTDPISDMLARIRNANRALLPGVELPHSKIKESIASILKKEGYINDFAVEGKFPKTIKLKLKYQGKKSIIEGLRRISTPGLRRYVGATDIPRVRGGLGVSVVSTSEGVMTGTQARKKNIGGELLCYVW